MYSMLKFIFLNQMHWLVEDIYNTGMAVGPVLAYVYQYHLIRKCKSTGTFSINLCGLLLFSNILKIGYYFFTPFSQALLVQASFMIFVQIMLLKLCIQTMVDEGNLIKAESTDAKPCYLLEIFWKWSSFSTYLIAISIFTMVVMISSISFSHYEIWYVGDLIGYAALLAQSLILLPQVLENWKQGRVKGLSHLLIVVNNTGDILELTYYLINDQPMPFILCGFIQEFVDVFIVLQILYFRCCKGSLNEEENNEENSLTNKQSQKSSAQTTTIIAESIETQTPKQNKKDNVESAMAAKDGIEVE